VEIVTTFLKKINEITQTVLSLKNIAQEKNAQQHIAKQNKTEGGIPSVFFVYKKNPKALHMKKA